MSVKGSSMLRQRNLQTNKMADTAGESSQVLRETNDDKENITDYEPIAKRAKLADVHPDFTNRLEDRLSGILCCAVCLDLPQTCFQVSYEL